MSDTAAPETPNTDAPTFGFRPVSDGMGGTRLEYGPLPVRKSAPAKGKAKKAKPAPDPIEANPEASAQQLRQFIERIENLRKEQDELAEAVRDVKSEAKEQGFSPKTIDRIVALRRMDAADRAEADAILDTYLTHLNLGEGKIV